MDDVPCAAEPRLKPTMEREEMRLLVIGKTGNGKSTLCNTLLGRKEFRTGCSMSSATLEAQVQSVEWNDFQVKVVDTPDPVNWDGPNRPNLAEEIQRWRAETSPYPSAILITIRCDVRYTAEEYDVYKQIKKAWGEGFTKRLIVAFTFGDRQDRDIEQELKEVNKELKTVLSHANNRYVVSKGRMDNGEELMKEIQRFVRKMDGEPADKIWYQDPYKLGLAGLAAVIGGIVVYWYKKPPSPSAGSSGSVVSAPTSSGGDRDGPVTSGFAAAAAAEKLSSRKDRQIGVNFSAHSSLYRSLGKVLLDLALGDVHTTILELGYNYFVKHRC